MPTPGAVGECANCSEVVYLTDGLRIHEQFFDEQSAAECHARYNDALELLALMNALRYMALTPEGLVALGESAFIKDGPLAAFGTIAVLAQGIRHELTRIDKLMKQSSANNRLLVLSGVKTGAFVGHRV